MAISIFFDEPTDQPTNRPTNQPTNKVAYRSSLPELKNSCNRNKIQEKLYHKKKIHRKKICEVKVPVTGRTILCCHRQKILVKHFLPKNVIWPTLPNQSHLTQFLVQFSPSMFNIRPQIPLILLRFQRAASPVVSGEIIILNVWIQRNQILIQPQRAGYR